MAVQKFIKYTSLDTNGQVLNDEHTLELNVLEKSGNSLIHKDILRHQINQKQGTVSTKTRSEVRGGGRKPWQTSSPSRACISTQVPVLCQCRQISESTRL